MFGNALMADHPSLPIRKERMYSSCWNIGRGDFGTWASTTRPSPTTHPLLNSIVAETPMMGTWLFTTSHIMR